MAFLVIVGIVVLLAILITIVEKFDKAKRFDQQISKFGELEKFQAETEQKRIESEKEIQFLREQLSRDEEALRKQLARDREAIVAIAKEKAIGFPWLAKAYDEYFELSDLQAEEFLRNKKHPAVKEAQRFRDASAAKRQALTHNRILKFQLAYYEELFPWLADYRDIEIDDASIRVQPTDESDDGEERDPAEYWLSVSEYKSLPTTEKYQMALDRYWNTKKSPLEVGRLYERYVGYHLPFDQQYDRTIVHADRGEFYAQTIAEAEKKGFRRAWRWRGIKQSGL
jgi:hypothetical protein